MRTRKNGHTDGQTDAITWTYYALFVTMRKCLKHSELDSFLHPVMPTDKTDTILPLTCYEVFAWYVAGNVPDFGITDVWTPPSLPLCPIQHSVLWFRNFFLLLLYNLKKGKVLFPPTLYACLAWPKILGQICLYYSRALKWYGKSHFYLVFYAVRMGKLYTYNL